jgi:hypothetical protein
MQELSNEQLVETIQSLRGDEKRIVADLLRYLHELDERRYYRELGYSSLHSYCTECLGYSDSAAWRRIGVFELRIPKGPGLRVYYALDGERLVLLLGGGDKSTQQRDIRAAKALWKEYRNEN